jgi:hypothetical protein
MMQRYVTITPSMAGQYHLTKRFEREALSPDSLVQFADFALEKAKVIKNGVIIDQVSCYFRRLQRFPYSLTPRLSIQL